MHIPLIYKRIASQRIKFSKHDDNTKQDTAAHIILSLEHYSSIYVWQRYFFRQRYFYFSTILL